VAALRRIAPRYIGFPSNRGSSEIRPASRPPRLSSSSFGSIRSSETWVGAGEYGGGDGGSGAAGLGGGDGGRGGSVGLGGGDGERSPIVHW